jgi:hypothetical protein
MLHPTPVYVSEHWTKSGKLSNVTVQVIHHLDKACRALWGHTKR